MPLQIIGIINHNERAPDVLHLGAAVVEPDVDVAWGDVLTYEQCGKGRIEDGEIVVSAADIRAAIAYEDLHLCEHCVERLGADLPEIELDEPHVEPEPVDEAPE